MADDAKTTTKERRKSAHLTARQKAEAKALWERGEVTLDDLSKKFGKAPETFSRLFSREGVQKGSKAKEVEKKTQAAVEAAMEREAVTLAQRVITCKDDHYKFFDALRKLTVAEIASARQRNAPLASVMNNIKTLREAAQVGDITQKKMFEILGINPLKDKADEDLPELKILELSQEKELELAERQQSADEDLDIGTSELPEDNEIVSMGDEDGEDERSS